MGSDLPRLYTAWMDQFLRGPIPTETDATCGDCAMVAGPLPRRQEPETALPRRQACVLKPRQNAR